MHHCIALIAVVLLFGFLVLAREPQSTLPMGSIALRMDSGFIDQRAARTRLMAPSPRPVATGQRVNPHHHRETYSRHVGVEVVPPKHQSLKF